MGYLVVGLVCSALVSIVLKAGDGRPYDRYAMLSVNYVVCLLCFLVTQVGKALPAIDSSLFFCMALAFVNGFLYIACMLANQLNVKRNGAILQSTFARLGVMVPTCLSIIFFGERPTVANAVGLVLVLVALCVMNLKQGEKYKSTKPALGLLFLSLIFGGVSDSMSKVFERFGSRSLDDLFVGLTFSFALIIALIIIKKKQERIGRRELCLGLALGIPNYISSLLLLKALSQVSAYIAYPTYSVGAILVVIILSSLIFKEKLSFWRWIGLILIIAAILLLNL